MPQNLPFSKRPSPLCKYSAFECAPIIAALAISRGVCEASHAIYMYILASKHIKRSCATRKVVNEYDRCESETGSEKWQIELKFANNEQLYIRRYILVALATRSVFVPFRFSPVTEPQRI